MTQTRKLIISKKELILFNMILFSNGKLVQNKIFR